MGVQAPTGLLGIHSNMPGTVPDNLDKATLAGEPPPAGLTAEERRAYEMLVVTYTQVGYARIMGTGPRRVRARRLTRGAGGLPDRPRGRWWPARERRHRGLQRSSSTTGELTRDEILDNITLYWLTNTGVSASRLYWEYKGGFFNVKGVKLPVAVTVFPFEQYQAPRSWAERAYPKLIYYNKVDRAATSPPGKSPSCSHPSLSGLPVPALSEAA